MTQLSDLELKIDYLIRKYEEDNMFKSFINVNDPSCIELISFGKKAIPHLLSYLGESWIIPVILYRITGEKINLLPEEYGNFNSVNEAWRQWGINNGYLDI